MNIIDNEKTDIQELKDYQMTVKILSKLFKAYEPNFSMMAKGCVFDAKMYFTDDKNELYRYHIEIKSRRQNMEEYDTLPLTVQKYCNIIESCKLGEKPIYISIVNDEEYYIFDLSRIDMNKVMIKNWYINDIEYSDYPTKKKIPTMFIPITESVNNGLI